MADLLGDREAAVTRELTKTFEEVRRGRLSALAAHYIEAGAPKGEIVVVVGPPTHEVVSLEDPQVTAAIDAGLADGMRVKDLATDLSAQFHLTQKRFVRRHSSAQGRSMNPHRETDKFSLAGAELRLTN